MRLIIESDYEALSRRAADIVGDRIRTFSPSGERPFVLGLPTGSSPLGMYRCLVQDVKGGKLSFRHVVTFNMDEYVGLPHDHPQSYHSFMYDNFFNHIDIPGDQIHLPDGMSEDPEAECLAYEDAIRAIGGIRLFVGGVGSDGHIAFNEPGSSLRSRTRIELLTRDTIVANSRFFGGDIAAVPVSAITVGVATITDAEEVLLLVSGHSKAPALAAMVEGPLSHMCTASAIQLHTRAVVLCDEDACDNLHVNTYRYFKGIETPFVH